MDIYFDLLLHSIVFALIFRTRIPNQIVNFVLIIFFFFSTIQLVIVGYKWQYVPLYVIIFIITTMHFFNMESKYKITKVFYYFLMFLIIGIGATLTYILPVPKFEIEIKNILLDMRSFTL